MTADLAEVRFFGAARVARGRRCRLLMLHSFAFSDVISSQPSLAVARLSHLLLSPVSVSQRRQAFASDARRRYAAFLTSPALRGQRNNQGSTELSPFCDGKTNVASTSLRRRICALLRSHQHQRRFTGEAPSLRPWFRAVIERMRAASLPEHKKTPFAPTTACGNASGKSIRRRTAGRDDKTLRDSLADVWDRRVARGRRVDWASPNPPRVRLRRKPPVVMCRVNPTHS